MNITEKMNITKGLGESYVDLWHLLLDQKGRELDRLADRDRAWRAAGWQSIEVRTGKGKIVDLPAFEAARYGFTIAQSGARVILDRARRYGWRSAWAIAGRALGGAGVAAGAEAIDSDRGAIKHIDQADRDTFSGIFAAHLAPFSDSIATIDRLLALSSSDRSVGKVWRAEAGDPDCGSLKVRAIAPLSWYESALLEAWRAAIRAADNECRSFVNSRGVGAPMDGSARVSFVSLDDPEYVAADRLSIAGEAVAMRPMSSGGGSSIVMVDRNYWDGVSGARLGWSRHARASSLETEIARVAALTAAYIDRQSPNNKPRARASFGGLVEQFRAVVAGEFTEDRMINGSLAIGDQGPIGDAARDALRVRVHRWKQAIDEQAAIERRERARDDYDPARAAAVMDDDGGCIAFPVAETARRVAISARQAIDRLRFVSDAQAAIDDARAVAWRSKCARAFAPRRRPAGALGALWRSAVGALGRASSPERWRAAGAALRAVRFEAGEIARVCPVSAALPALVALVVSAHLVSLCEIKARACELRALRAAVASVVDLRARRASHRVASLLERARLRALSLLQSLRSIGGVTAMLADRAVSGVDLSGGVAEDRDPVAEDRDPVGNTKQAIADRAYVLNCALASVSVVRSAALRADRAAALCGRAVAAAAAIDRKLRARLIRCQRIARLSLLLRTAAARAVCNSSARKLRVRRAAAATVADKLRALRSAAAAAAAAAVVVAADIHARTAARSAARAARAGKLRVRRAAAARARGAARAFAVVVLSASARDLALLARAARPAWLVRR